MIKKIIALTMLSGSLLAMDADVSTSDALQTKPGLHYVFPGDNVQFASLSPENQEIAQALIDTANTRQKESFGETGISIGNIFPKQINRIKEGHPWHAVLASTMLEEEEVTQALIVFGQFPTTTYVQDLESHRALHAAFKDMDLVTDDIVDSKHVAVKGEGLATFLWAFADGVSTERKQQIIQSALKMARNIALEKKPLPDYGLQARDLFVLVHPDDPISSVFLSLEFLETEGPWDMFYGKPRTAFMYPLTETFSVSASVAEAVLADSEGAEEGVDGVATLPHTRSSSSDASPTGNSGE